jgi:hypothetical protein
MQYRELQKQLKKFRDGGKINKSFRLNQQKKTLNKMFKKLMRKRMKDRLTPRIKEDDIKLKRTITDSINGFENVRFKTNTRTLRGLWDAINKAIRLNRFGRAHITLFMKDKRTNKIQKRRGFNISPDFTESYEDFVSRIQDILTEQVEGSDKYDLVNYDIVYNYFDIMMTKAKGEGKDDKIIFKCKKFKDDLNCWYHTLKGLKIKCDKNNDNLKYYENFREYLIENNSDNKIISNSFILKDINNFYQKPYEKIYYSGRKRDIPVRKVDINDIKINVLFNDENGKDHDYIIYDIINQHYTYTKNIELKDNIYMDNNKTIYFKIKKGKKIHLEKIQSVKERNIELDAKFDFKVKYIFFDYETVVDFKESSVMKDYSLSFLVLDDKQLIHLNKLDLEKKSKKDILNYLNGKLFNCVKFNSTDMLRDYVIANQKDTAFKFISFNGCNFDNFILLQHLLKNKSKNWKASNIFYNGTSLLNIRINGSNRHSCFDLRKHLVGSLESNCVSYKINSCAKTKFDHNHAQTLYEKGKLLEYMRNNKKLIEYNNFDVISLAVLYFRYKEVTIGSIIYDIFRKECRKNNFYFNSKDKKCEKSRLLADIVEDEKENFLLTQKEYNDLQKYKCAGRVQMFNGCIEIFERVVSLDVCSLYPYVLSILNCYYPYGEITRTDKFMGFDKIGFYYCDVDQSNLRKNNLPNIYAEKLSSENKWDSDKKLEGYLLSTVIIKGLKDYGCKVDIKNGFYWEKKAKSCHMFGFLLEFMGAKNEQDLLKKAKSGLYNGALRECLKLLMNSISGKIIENLHLEKTVATTAEQYAKLVDNKKIEKITTINVIGDSVFTTFKYKQEEKLSQQRPIFLGVLCYDYAKMYMYRNCYSIIGLKDLLYTDTDAGKFRDRHMERFLKHSNKTVVPHWREVEKYDVRYKTHKLYNDKTKVFGSFENELTNNNYFCCVQKKAWCVYDNDKLVKWGFKGVSSKSILLDDLSILYNRSKNMNLDFYKYSINNNKRRLEYTDEEGNNPNIKKLFKRLLKDGYAYVLCQSFKKSVRNLKQASINDIDKFNEKINTISLNHVIKDIILNKYKRCKTCNRIVNKFDKSKCGECINYKLVMKELNKKFK